MVASSTLEQRGPIADEERMTPEKAKTLPAAFDKDCPELAEEDLKGFHRAIMKEVHESSH